MIPLRDSPLRRNKSRITTGLIIVNVVIFFFQSLLFPNELRAFIEQFALVPQKFFSPYRLNLNVLDYLSFITNMFLHGSLLHLISNMWTLWIFGPSVEDRIGGGRFLMFYLLAGLGASWTHAFFNQSSAIPTLGASGAISGVLGCYVRLFPKSQILMILPIPFLPIFFPISALSYAIFWLVSQVVPAVMELLYPRQEGGVAWWAHVGGFVAGWYLVPIFNRKKRARTLFIDREEDWLNRRYYPPQRW